MSSGDGHEATSIGRFWQHCGVRGDQAAENFNLVVQQLTISDTTKKI
jgi:hypothetical protein